MLNSASMVVHECWWYPNNRAGNPTKVYGTGAPTSETYLLPGWLVSSLKARGLNLMDIMEKGLANQYLSPEEQAHMLAANRFFQNNQDPIEINGKSVVSPLKGLLVYSSEWIDNKTAQNHNEFAHILSRSEEIRNTVANKLFREPPAFSDRKEEKPYSFVRGTKAIWIIVQEGFLYEMKRQDDQKMFFEDYLRFVSKHSRIHELARSSPFFAEAIGRL